MFALFVHSIVQNFRSIWWGKNLLWHLVAIVLTATVVLSGMDWWFFTLTRSEWFHPLVWAAGIGGFFTPILVPLVIYLYGEFKKRPDLMKMGMVAAQAALLAYLVSIMYKSVTGRMEPEFLTTYSMMDNSRAFNFGFLEHGVFWGWPSSHTAVAFAGAFAIIFMTRNVPARIVACVYAIGIGTGAAIGFHWLSDALAGAIFGILTASIVASSFTRRS